ATQMYKLFNYATLSIWTFDKLPNLYTQYLGIFEYFVRFSHIQGRCQDYSGVWAKLMMYPNSRII
ncbi:MAG: hypothetical protein B6I38_02260, partial [Anaerolineaceae bacterium 4572_5.1]